jgi:hypothetical protein
MTGPAWCLAAALAAAGAALTGRAIGRRRARERAHRLLEAQAYTAWLRAQGHRAIDPEWRRLVADHPDLRNWQRER